MALARLSESAGVSLNVMHFPVHPTGRFGQGSRRASLQSRGWKFR
jgi:hypothetical protein